MGLLDSLRYSTGDPDKDAQLNRGLLEMGLQLMQARGPLLSAVGQSGLAGLMAADRTRQQQGQQRAMTMQEQMQKLQLGQAQREAALAKLPQQFYRAPSSPVTDPIGGMETAVEAPNNASGPGGFDMQGYVQALMAHDPRQALALRATLDKPAASPIKGSPGDVFFHPTTFAPLASVPNKPDGEKDAFLRIMNAAGIDPASDQGRKMLASYLQKQATHAPPVAIHNAPYAPVMTVEGPNGPMAIQPGSRPGQAPQVVVNPATGKPAVPVKDSGAGKDPTEFQAKAALYFKSMQTASETLTRIEGRGGADARPTLAEMVAPEKGKEFLRTAGRKAYVQGQRQWIDSINRVRSGANLPEIEYDRAVVTFFPTASDGAPEIAQKAAARRQEEQAMQAAAGRALPQSGPAGTASAADSDPLGLRRK